MLPLSQSTTTGISMDGRLDVNEGSKFRMPQATRTQATALQMVTDAFEAEREHAMSRLQLLERKVMSMLDKQRQAEESPLPDSSTPSASKAEFLREAAEAQPAAAEVFPTDCLPLTDASKSYEDKIHNQQRTSVATTGDPQDVEEQKGQVIQDLQTMHSATPQKFEMRFPIKQVLNARKRWSNFAASMPMPQTCLARIVSSTSFGCMVLVFIVLNIVCLGFDSELLIEEPHLKGTMEGHTFESVFTFALALELILKVVALRWYFITGDDARMNLFDSLIVALSLPGAFGHPLNATFVRVLRLSRVVRMVDILKDIHFFTDLRKVMIMMKGSVSVLFWVAVTCSFCMLCFGILLMQSVATYICGAHASVEVSQELRERYGTVPLTLLTLFHTISGGDWYDASEALNDAHVSYKFCFGLYIFFMSFGLVNVVIGLFCERAVEAVEGDRALRTHKESLWASSFNSEMEEIFEEMDAQGTGEIQWEQFHNYISNQVTGSFLRSHGIATHDAKGLFHLLDGLDGAPNGSMDLPCFVLGMTRIAGGAKGADMALVKVNLRSLKTDIQDIKSLLTKQREEATHASNTTPALQRVMHI